MKDKYVTTPGCLLHRGIKQRGQRKELEDLLNEPRLRVDNWIEFSMSNPSMHCLFILLMLTAYDAEL